jgi:hypothetical protein
VEEKLQSINSEIKNVPYQGGGVQGKHVPSALIMGVENLWKVHPNHKNFSFFGRKNQKKFSKKY